VIQLAVIGCGQRMRHMIETMGRLNADTRVSALLDPRAGQLRERYPNGVRVTAKITKISRGVYVEGSAVGVEAGVGEEEAFDTVLPWLSDRRCTELAHECLELYCWDRLGADN